MLSWIPVKAEFRIPEKINSWSYLMIQLKNPRFQSLNVFGFQIPIHRAIFLTLGLSLAQASVKSLFFHRQGLVLMELTIIRANVLKDGSVKIAHQIVTNVQVIHVVTMVLVMILSTITTCVYFVVYFTSWIMIYSCYNNFRVNFIEGNI